MPTPSNRLSVLAACSFLAGCGAAPAPAPARAASPAPASEPETPDEPVAAAVDAAPAAAASEPLPAVAPVAGLSAAPFGDARYGFVEATSGNGRFVVLRRFLGSGPPEFGHHGEVFGGTEVIVVDLADLSTRVVAEIIDIEPSRRFVLLLEGDVAVLLDTVTATYAPLPDADTRGDGNPVLPPRQASFSAYGRRVGWVASGARRVHVRDLETGAEWTVDSPAQVWRVWPDDEGRGAFLGEIALSETSFPVQQTSLGCRWCARFAMSYGMYGWGGPAFTLIHVDDRGARAEADLLDGPREWFASDVEGCTITPVSSEGGVDQGPWRRTCGAATVAP